MILKTTRTNQEQNQIIEEPAKPNSLSYTLIGDTEIMILKINRMNQDLTK